MFLRGPIKRISLLFGIFFVITFMAYFYLTHKNPDLANFDERLEDFKHKGWNFLEEQRPLEGLKLKRPVEDLSRYFIAFTIIFIRLAFSYFHTVQFLGVNSHRNA